MTIFVTKRAYRNYTSIKARITERWGEFVAETFEQKIKDFLDLLEQFPQMGTVEVSEKQIHGFQVTRQTRVLYRIKANRIIVLSFFDVRQHPDKKDI